MKLPYHILCMISSSWIGPERMFLVLWNRTELSSSQTDLEPLAVLGNLSATSLVDCQGKKREQELQVKALCLKKV